MTDHAAQLEGKARDRTAVFGVVGLGYVGLPLAVEVADAGYHVVGFDTNPGVVDVLNQGRSHIADVPTDRFRPLVDGGQIEATTDMSRLRDVDVISICVPTPLSKTKSS